MSAVSRGHGRERQVKKLLEAEGWFVLRAPASLGVADLVALKAGERPRMIEVKMTAGGPYHSFSPADRAELREAAKLAGAAAELCHWPASKPIRWYDEAVWP